jgi:hypothetical protein
VITTAQFEALAKRVEQLEILIGIRAPKVNGHTNGFEYTESFAKFWEAYPNKTAKGDAFKAWQKIKSRPAVEILLAAVEKQKSCSQWKRDSGQFIPHPSTWLNQRRWEDEAQLPLSNKSSVEDWNNYKPGSK